MSWRTKPSSVNENHVCHRRASRVEEDGSEGSRCYLGDGRWYNVGRGRRAVYFANLIIVEIACAAPSAMSACSSGKAKRKSNDKRHEHNEVVTSRRGIKALPHASHRRAVCTSLRASATSSPSDKALHHHFIALAAARIGRALGTIKYDDA